jgi:23S rRNA pseudouridine1911/1915/1917 synthase
MNYPEIIYNDDDLTVINKPAGWVVHEGAGETGETVVDWFVKNYPAVAHHYWPEPGRMGIVHRLDKDTSGVMVLAKSPAVLELLQKQFQSRTTIKIYKAILFDVPKQTEGIIETFIGRHPKRRQEQTVLPIQIGERARREAITRYKVDHGFLYKNQPLSLVTFYPKTGRMHQLRVHAKYLGTPILGDQTYTIKPAKRLSKELGVHRQLLHAYSLQFVHPIKNDSQTACADLPKDMQALLEKLQ